MVAGAPEQPRLTSGVAVSLLASSQLIFTHSSNLARFVKKAASDIAPANQAHEEPLRQGSAAVLKSQLQDALGQRCRQTAPAAVLHLAGPHRVRGGGDDDLMLALCRGRITCRMRHTACTSGCAFGGGVEARRGSYSPDSLKADAVSRCVVVMCLSLVVEAQHAQHAYRGNESSRASPWRTSLNVDRDSHCVSRASRSLG